MQKNYQRLLQDIDSLSTITWFDVGLFFDRINENRKLKSSIIKKDDIFKRIQQGIAFITFNYGIDGVTVEVGKYANAFEDLIQDKTGKSPKIYWVAETIKEESKEIIKPHWKSLEIEGAGGFVDWDGYEECFKTKFARGSKEYNELIVKIWNQTKELIKRLGVFVVDNDIQLLFPVNICSNPGNIPLAMSMILLSEYLSIPVFNSNHDFYWEDGLPVWEREGSQKKGVRDHFFMNADIGEVFSFLENFFPWNSPLWFHSVLNKIQHKKLIYDFGFSPSYVSPLPTSIDIEKYRPVREYRHHDILDRLQLLFSGIKGNKRAKAANDFKKMSSNWFKNPCPLILGSKKGLKYHLDTNNLLFVQPTRILARKRIELNFKLIESLLKFPDFNKLFDSFQDLSITLLITGPVTSEHFSYVEKIVQKFTKLLSNVNKRYRDRIFLAFKFGIDDNTEFKKQNKLPLEIHEIFGVANLVVLPSQQEGRGLPILEASACGVPIMATRYHPEEVFAEVVGESLDASLRLNVLDFPSYSEFTQDTLKQLTNYFSDPHFYSVDLEHNINVIKKRFSHNILVQSFKNDLEILECNLMQGPSIKESVEKAFEFYKKNTKYGKAFNSLTLSKNRTYLPGITKLENMVYLKSLIDPSFFRMEEKYLFGRIFRYAYKSIQKIINLIDIPEEQQILFYHCVQYLFEYYKGEKKLIVDHSLSYRHRHLKHYAFRDLTESELRGMVGILLREILPEKFYLPPRKSSFNSLLTHLSGNIEALVGTHRIGIDNLAWLEKELESSKPIAWFPGISFLMEAMIFVEWTILHRLGFNVNEQITEKMLQPFKPEKVGTVTLFVRNVYLGGHVVCYNYVSEWIKTKAPSNIRLLYKKKFFKIVKTNVISNGTHLGQLGNKADNELLRIKEQNGFIVSVGNNNMLTFDLVDIPRYNLGVASGPLIANYLGIRKGEGYILWVPAGLRPSLSFPTPIQTPKEFSELLNSDLFIKCCKIHGKNKVLQLLREDADRYSTPIKEILEGLSIEKNKSKKNKIESIVESKHVVGCQPDGSPWSGAYAKVTFNSNGAKGKGVKFTSAFSKTRSDTVFAIMKQFKKGNVILGWNGGYILNPELVGKLGLPEDYIGSPLGLLICENEVLSVPLFNKPALTFNTMGVPAIRRANLDNGIKIKTKKGKMIEFTPRDKNNPSSKYSFFNLLYPKEEIQAKNRVIYRFSGNKIIEIVKGESGKVPILPVGLNVSIESGLEPADWKVGSTVIFELPGWEDIPNAVEAGPMLCKDGRVAIDMEKDGWTTTASIRTQAARIDYTHMRGPKIAVGISKKNELIIVAVNGRLRESVGVTHSELASVLLEQGAYDAMGFDPGGSVTLIVNGKQLNISPYNKDYLKNIYSLPPEPRFVGNAVLGYVSE